MSQRFPFPIPYGWFFIDFVDSVAPGELRQVRAFRRDLILWRGEDGICHLQDAYCPHLGANIAAGGKVVGNTVQCPFHLWTFSADGSVADIPYSNKINKNACLRTYQVEEHYGNIMAWYHPTDAAPLFDLPEITELESGEFVGPISERHLVQTCLQEMAENTVDGAHFVTVHEHPGAATYENVEFDGDEMRMHSKQLFPSSKGPVEGTLGSHSWGFGLGVVRYETLASVCLIALLRPIENDLTEQVFQVYYRNPGNDPKLDRIGAAFAAEVNRQSRQDQPIWAAKIYQPRPCLAEGDGPITRFRRWARRFYPGWSEAEALAETKAA